ncbi:MAG: hypothetical protein WEC79_05180 [Thermomicrobiales bacterium]
MFDTPILGLIVAVAAVATLADTWRDRVALFDARFTADERQRVLRLAMFVLLPLSVLAHEGGHAVFVKLFGGEIVDFGFYMVYGYVAHIGRYTPLELALIAFSGSAVNIVLGVAAFLLAWFRPLPKRPAFNYLLFVFAALEFFNALIFYPVFDALGGIAGDWSTIYSRETPVFSLLIGLLHVALLAAAAVIWRSPRFHAGYSERTGLRRVGATPGGPNAGSNADDADEQRELTGVLTVAAALATDGWRHQVQLVSDALLGGAQVIIRWQSGGFQRALLVHATLSSDPDQHVELHAAIEPDAKEMPPYERSLARIDGQPTAQELVPYISRFLDFVDSWNGATVSTPN